MASSGTQRGIFVVLDGVDGCGKSTQAARLVERLGEFGPGGVLHLREPGSTYLGESLRAMLLDPHAMIGVGAETLLFAAARRQLLDELVEPALAAGRAVVCERGNASTFAYQAVAGELDAASVLALLGAWCATPAPDLELLLDLPVERALERRGAASDRIEERGSDYLRAVADGYRRYVARTVGARAIDASADRDSVAEAIWDTVRELFDGRG